MATLDFISIPAVSVSAAGIVYIAFDRLETIASLDLKKSMSNWIKVFIN